jgi:hypothetical protein
MSSLDKDYLSNHGSVSVWVRLLDMPSHLRLREKPSRLLKKVHERLDFYFVLKY